MSLEWLNRLSDRAILLVLLIVGVATSGASLIVNVTNNRITSEWWEGWLQNFSTEMFGAFLGFLLLGMIVEKRRQWEAKQEVQEELKQRLIQEMRSQVNDIARSAAEEIHAHGWFQDGSLQNAFLFGGNLQGVELGGVNLKRTILAYTNLQGAFLHSTNLEGANLIGTYLQGANLEEANLQEAYLERANLQEANLHSADLKGANLGANLESANLERANLQGADFFLATFSKETILPDDKKWTPETDMARFTDPEHPQFWRSDDPTSPAYRGDEGDGANE